MLAPIDGAMKDYDENVTDYFDLHYLYPVTHNIDINKPRIKIDVIFIFIFYFHFFKLHIKHINLMGYSINK